MNPGQILNDVVAGAIVKVVMAAVVARIRSRRGGGTSASG